MRTGITLPFLQVFQGTARGIMSHHSPKSTAIKYIKYTGDLVDAVTSLLIYANFNSQFKKVNSYFQNTL